jgi:hypothetical protein
MIKVLIKRILKFIAFIISFCLITLYGILPMRLRLIFLKAFSLLVTKIKPVFNLRLPPNKPPVYIEKPLEPRHEEDACVHYSGGSDSTLVASYLAENYRKVHLLTFRHCAISSIENRQFNIENLSKKYGKDRFANKLIDIDDLFKKMYTGRQWKDFHRYFMFTLVPCGTCRFAMHIRTIVYCIQNNVKWISDGSNQFYQMVAPSEMPDILNLVKELYRAYGIQYIINPAYNKLDADNELYEKGIVPEKGLRVNWDTYKKIQPVCNCGLFFLIMARTYWFYLHGVDQLSRTAFRYYEEKLPWYKSLVEEELALNKPS